MQQVLLAGILLVAGYSFLSFFKAWRSFYIHSQHAKRLGCGRAWIKRNKYPGGIDHILRIIKADQRGDIPNEYFKIYKEQDYKTYEQALLGSKQFATVDPKNVQAILATQFQDFELGHIRRDAFLPLLGLGIFTTDGERWAHSRAMLRPQFTRAQVADLELEETHVQHLFRQLESIQSPAGWISSVDLGPLFFRLTIDSITQILLGQSIHSQSHSSGNITHDMGLNLGSVADAFDRGTAALGVRMRLSGIYWLYNPKQFQEDCSEVHRFVDHFVDLALEKEASESDKRLEDKYVFLQELVKVSRNKTELRSELLNILLAGRDTTAGLLGWTCWNLARHPSVFHKLRTTILESFGTYDKPRDITFTSLKSCTYLQHVLNETLRLFPSVPLNVRLAARDTTIPRGGGTDGLSPVYIRKGQEVAYSVYVMHRRKDLWGQDAETFNPERWVGRKPGWEYLPFNGGPRICLGQQFALTEVGYVITRLLQKYDRMESSDPISTPLHRYSVTSAPKHVLVNLHLASSQ